MSVSTPPATGRPGLRLPVPFDAITFRRHVDGAEVEITIDRSRLARLIGRRVSLNSSGTASSFHGAIIATIAPA